MSSEQLEKERIAVTVQFPASVARRVAELAKSDKRSFGFVVRESVVEYLDKQKVSQA
jgi:predicted transcriptional regulator